MNEHNPNRGRINYGISQTNSDRFQNWFDGLNGDFSWIFDRNFGANSLPENVYHAVNAYPYLFRFDEDNVENITYLTLCNQRVTEMQAHSTIRQSLSHLMMTEVPNCNVLEEEDLVLLDNKVWVLFFASLLIFLINKLDKTKYIKNKFVFHL